MNIPAQEVVIAALTGALLFLPSSGWSEARTETPTLILNEDDSHFFGSRSAEQMTIEGLQKGVAPYY